jgi:hypothetical protein
VTDLWLVRFATRPAAWGTHTLIDDTVRAEFSERGDGTALSRVLSVFELEPSELVAALAQFAATTIDPKRTHAINIRDAVEGRQLVRTKGDTAFQLTQDCHFDFYLRDEADLRALVAHWKQTLPERSREIAPKEVGDYVRGRFAAADPEWRALFTSGKAKRWVKELAEKTRPTI